MASLTLDGYNQAIEELRASEYPMLGDAVYLDHAGSTLCSKSVINLFAQEMTNNLYGNPHSLSWPSQRSTARIEDTRLRLLEFFNADPATYDLVFVANATAGVKLVVEAMRCLPQGFQLAYHEACHTSIVGAREEAVASVCLDDGDVKNWFAGKDPFDPASNEKLSTLFAYSAQSHLDGRRYPFEWSKQPAERSIGGSHRTYTLLDAASFCATSELDLSRSDMSADFTVLSLYKVFGFPDLGALIVRRDAEAVFDSRKYFGGGTVDIVITGEEQWHASKSQTLHDRLEDGTLPFHNIIALDAAIDTHRKLFGSMKQVSSHTSYLTSKLVHALKDLQHANGKSVCMLYTDLNKDEWSLGTGPVVSFNLRRSDGGWVSLYEFEKLAVLKKMYIRTGGVCSPGGIAAALSLKPWEMKQNFSAGFRCGSGYDVIGNKPTGVMRVSFGAMSTLTDVTRFVAVLKEFYVETQPAPSEPLPRERTDITCPPLRVKRITVYPIKSCAGFNVPEGTRWNVRSEGLSWDREWCILHKGSGQALSQKRYPRMALLKPFLDFEKGVLRIQFSEHEVDSKASDLTIPLSDNPALYELSDWKSSKVCGDSISTKIYASNEIHAFFSTALGVPCVLARFPPGGQGMHSRFSRLGDGSSRIASNYGSQIPSPPDSDSEHRSKSSKILLSNESPILMIHQASVDSLNHIIRGNGGTGVSNSAFRANIVVEGSSNDQTPTAYSEDLWQNVRIERHLFKILGGCQRCQMVCVDQRTGEKRQEPFITLAKTRRHNGKVYFGMHMRIDPGIDKLGTREDDHRLLHHPLAVAVAVGDTVSVES